METSCTIYDNKTESVFGVEDRAGEATERLRCANGGFRTFLLLEEAGKGRTGNQRGHCNCYLAPLFTLWNFSFCDCRSLSTVMTEPHFNLLYISVAFNFFCSKVGLL